MPASPLPLSAVGAVHSWPQIKGVTRVSTVGTDRLSIRSLGEGVDLYIAIFDIWLEPFRLWWGENRRIVVPILSYATILALALMLLVFAFRQFQRAKASNALGVRIPRRIRVRGARVPHEMGAFVLRYPRWRYAKKDGTRDRRRRENSVVKPWSVLEVGKWCFASRNVLILYDFVSRIRNAGIPVAACKEESHKIRQEHLARVRRQQAASIWEIHSRFAGAYREFEYYCADVFRAHGYSVEVTPASGDGGVDLRMERDGIRTIVECKCFRPNSKVGRPVIQKLVGANQVERAHHTMVVTTARFSDEAVEYARQVGTQLVDGTRLLGMHTRIWKTEPAPLVPESVTLTRDDLLARFPADLRS